MKVDAIKLWPNLPGDKPLTFLDFLLSNCLPMDLQIMFLANFEKKKLDIPISAKFLHVSKLFWSHIFV